MNFTIDGCDPTKMMFQHSRTNSEYQKYVSGKSQLTQLYSDLFELLMYTGEKFTRTQRDSLFRAYRIELANAEIEQRQLEYEYISLHPDSYLSVYIINERLKYYDGQDFTEYLRFMSVLDSLQLRRFQLYQRLKHITSLKPWNKGDKFVCNEIVEQANGTKNLLTSLIADDPMFIFFWRRDCPHSDKLMHRLNEAIWNGVLEAERILSINYERNITDIEKMELQSKVLFPLVFYNMNMSEDLIHRFWINFTPFGVILNDGII